MKKNTVKFVAVIALLAVAGGAYYFLAPGKTQPAAVAGDKGKAAP